jgi:N-sulfoglucosamine sulfohydrolase
LEIRPDEELYNLAKDPYCLNNLATNAGYNPARRRLHETLYLELLEQDDPRMYGRGEIFDKYPYANGNMRNFYSRFMKNEIRKEDAGWVNNTDFEKIR